MCRHEYTEQAKPRFFFCSLQLSRFNREDEEEEETTLSSQKVKPVSTRQEKEVFQTNFVKFN